MQPRARRGQLTPAASGASATWAASTAPASTTIASRASANCRPGDEVHLGRTHLSSSRTWTSCPTCRAPRAAEPDSGRVDQEAPRPDALPDARPPPPTPSRRRRRRRDTAVRATPSAATCRCSTASPSTWARPPTYEELCRIVLDALLEAIPAEVGAILSVVPAAAGAAGRRRRAAAKRGRGAELEVTAHRHRDPSVQHYTPRLGLRQQRGARQPEAILAEDVARDRYLRNRESLTRPGRDQPDLRPILFGDRVLGLIHLYCTDPLKALDAEDLEFTVAVAKQLGGVIHQLQQQQSLSAENRSLRDQLQGRERAGRRQPADPARSSGRSAGWPAPTPPA